MAKNGSLKNVLSGVWRSFRLRNQMSGVWRFLNLFLNSGPLCAMTVLRQGDLDLHGDLGE